MYTLINKLCNRQSVQHNQNLTYTMIHPNIIRSSTKQATRLDLSYTTNKAERHRNMIATKF